MPISFVMEVVKLKRSLPAFLVTCGLVIGLFAMKPHEAFAACNWLVNPACNAWNVQVQPPGWQTVGQNNLNILVTFTNTNPYPVTFHTSATQASVGSYNGASTTSHQNIIVNPKNTQPFLFNIPASYFAPANLSPGAYQATFNASFSVTAVSSINLVSTTQTISAPSAPFKVIVGQATNPNCIPGVTCPGGPPPVQTLSATMTFQATTPGGMDEPAGTAKFGDQITATVTATSPAVPPSSPPPPPPNGSLVSSSFAWTGPTTIQSGTLNFPGISQPEFAAPSETTIANGSETTIANGTSITAFSPQTPDTANKYDTLHAQFGGAPVDHYCYNCTFPQLDANGEPIPNAYAQFKASATNVGTITFLEDFAGFNAAQQCPQGNACPQWNNGGSGWPVTVSLTANRPGVWTYNYEVCPPKVACFPVTINVPVTAIADESAQASISVTGSNRWALSVWQGGNGLP